MFLPYGRQWITSEDRREIDAVLSGDWLTQGPKVQEFETLVAEYTGVPYAVSFCNGTAALHGAMHAAGVGPGEWILTSPLTFASTANGALFTGGDVVFGDIHPETLCLDPGEVRKILDKAEKLPRAVVPVSYAGYPAPLEEYRKAVGSRDVLIIEDACHALGGDREGKKVGCHADMTVLSFHPVKHITTGEGGMVLTRSEELAKSLRLFRTHGITKEEADFEYPSHGPWYYEMQDLGWNYRLTDMQCALGISQMKRLDSFIRRRREIAGLYRKSFAGIEEICCPPSHDGHAWHLYPLWVVPEKRRGLFEYLRSREIGVQVHYVPVHFQPYYRRRYGHKEGDFPRAERFYGGEISLPMFPRMTEDDVLRVVEEIVTGLRKVG
ncbi:MAG TPA: UDP-4-amino-4,6-dideoxy-N-acetyl-beta-L-altrosamine transaminase [Synergistaceae bacterium]|nr:UDP-4-amino-4,6-dideoxy-N-acetyl-beta-L-altrosamine transaminase [Synergistaceae bacterium]